MSTGNFFLFSTCRAIPSDMSQAAEEVVVDGPQQNEKLKLIAFYFIQILLNECSSIKKHNLIALYSWFSCVSSGIKLNKFQTCQGWFWPKMAWLSVRKFEFTIFEGWYWNIFKSKIRQAREWHQSTNGHEFSVVLHFEVWDHWKKGNHLGVTPCCSLTEVSHLKASQRIISSTRKKFSKAIYLESYRSPCNWQPFS